MILVPIDRSMAKSLYDSKLTYWGLAELQQLLKMEENHYWVYPHDFITCDLEPDSQVMSLDDLIKMLGVQCQSKV